MTVLDIIEQKQLIKHKLFKNIYAFCELDNTQKSVIDASFNNNIVSVCGAAGTGKTTVIVNLALNYIFQNKKVLICSKTDNAVNVIYQRLLKFNDYAVMRAGDKTLLSNKIDNILEKKINLDFVKKGLFGRLQPLGQLQNAINTRLAACMESKELRQSLLSYKNSMYWTDGKTVCDNHFATILELLPCWCVNSLKIADSIPLEQDLFDVAIIDEASQCDIASSLPVLYRVKKAVIIGDNKQLKHISFLAKNKEKSFFKKNDVKPDEQLIWRYRTNSLYDWALYYADKQIMLKTQYRMPINLFNFSNQKFYNGAVTSNNANNGGLFNCYVDGLQDNGKSRNFVEVETIARWLKKNMQNEKSYAVISPFVEQVKLLDKVLNKILTAEQLQRLTISTVYGMQGAEADTVLISWVIADNSPQQLQTFINKENLFNVAVTRAKENIINFYSCKHARGLLFEYLSNTKVLEKK